MNLWNQKFRTWGVFVACFVLVLAGLAALGGRLTPVAAGMVLQQADAEREDTDAVNDDSSTEPTSDVVVHRMNLGGSNGYLLETPEGLILVDAGIPFSHLIVQRKMNEIGRDDLKLIYITHAHIDHYGGANALREATGAPIAIHRADAESMAQGRTELGTVRDWKKTSDRTLPWIEPLLTLTPTEADILLEDGDSLEEYGINAYVLHTPGHTPGSSTLILDDHIAFVGDLLASNGKVHAQRSFANDWLEVARSLARLREVGPDVIYPGHGSEPIKSGQLDDVDANFVE